MTSWPELESQVFFHVSKRSPVVVVRGQGSRVWDEDGKEYLDLIAGWAVNTLGHCHPVMVEALSNQARQLIHTSAQFYTIPQLELAKLLVDHSPMDRVFFGNSGAEANEGAVKLARKWGKRHRDGAYGIITTLGSFHGRTLSMVAATGKPAYQEPFRPLPEGFVNVPFNDIHAIKAATTASTVGVMLEPVQGEGGVNVPDEHYLREVRAWCDEQNLLFIADEVQTGVGRLGTLWGHTQFGVVPDIMTTAKGLGGGIPIGAFMGTERVSVLEPGDHGSTYGGNPLMCATALAVMRYVLEHDVVSNVVRVSAHFIRRLQELRQRWPMATHVRGRGLLLALQFDREIASELLHAAVDEGLLINPVTPSAIRFMPALNITEAEIDEAVERLERALGRVLTEEAPVQGV